MADRDERIETLYQESAWDLAESVVDLEDIIARVRAVLEAEEARMIDPEKARIRTSSIRTALEGTDG